MKISADHSALALATVLGVAGVAHFARPELFDALVPEELPGSQRTWTHGSGVAELVCATAIAVPKTRRLGGLAAAALFVGVFPGNVQMAVDYERKKKPLTARAIAWARLPLQYPLVRWALRVRAGA